MFASNAFAGQNDWTKTEHNYNLKYKEYGVNLRQYYRNDYTKFTSDFLER